MRVAVIGSGISGLGTSLLLHQKHEVHLFEADTRLGGHAHTTEIQNNGDRFNVDTGFLVYNEMTYPHLIGMFSHLGVETVPSDMSLSIQVPKIGLEWGGENLNTVFAQRKFFLSRLTTSFYWIYSSSTVGLRKTAGFPKKKNGL